MGRAELGRILKPSPFLFCKAQPSPAHVCLSPSRPVSGLLNTSTHEGALQSTTKTNLVLSLTKSSRSYLIALIFWEMSKCDRKETLTTSSNKSCCKLKTQSRINSFHSSETEGASCGSLLLQLPPLICLGQMKFD